ncbi:hypothetical protein D3C84_892630 [compost metagenome]
MLQQVTNVRIAFHKPEQLALHKSERHLLGGENREAFVQIKPHLITERRDRARSRAVLLARSVIQYMAQ